MRINAHCNNRKITRGRHTQRIKVPKYIIKPGLQEEELELAKIIYGFVDLKTRPDLFVLNPNKYAGKTKVVFHKPTIKQ